MKKFLKSITKNKGMFVVITILTILLTGATGYLIYTLSLLNNIENFLRSCGMIILIILWLLFVAFGLRCLLKRKMRPFLIQTIISLVYLILIFLIAFNIQKIYDKLSGISSNSTTYSSSIVTRNDNSVNDLSGMGNANIGRIEDQNSVDGYTIPGEIITEKHLTNEIVTYDDFVSMIQALYDKKIDYIFLPTNYIVMFKNLEGLENLASSTKIIYSQQKKVKNQVSNPNKKITDPITILLMGVDSTEAKIQDSSFNGDALMLITFNPNTLNSTILSIPRDTYVPIACMNGRKNKITHSAWYGEECVQKTIEDNFDLKIDYHVKINFKGVVKLVDALGGIDVDVPITFCEQNSDREFGSKEICLTKGQQHLNGEQALALSRHRHTINDFIRGQNQQLVVKALMNKLKDINNLDTIYKLLDTINVNMETNMTTNEILSFYDVAKDILQKSKESSSVEDILHMQKLYISGYDAMIYDYSTVHNAGTKMTLYDFIPYPGSIKDVMKAMKINLGILPEDNKKSFSFDVNTPYQETVIGKGEYHESNLTQLPSFIGKDKSVATSYGANRGIHVNVEYVTTKESGHFVGEIIDQSLPSGMDISEISTSKGFTIKVIEKIDVTDVPPTIDYTACGLEENKDSAICQLENFVGKDISYMSTWEKKYKLSILIEKKMIALTDPDYDATKAGKIVKQSKDPGTSLYSILNQTIVITYMEMAPKEPEKPTDPDPIDPTVPPDPTTPDEGTGSITP